MAENTENHGIDGMRVCADAAGIEAADYWFNKPHPRLPAFIDLVWIDETIPLRYFLAILPRIERYHDRPNPSATRLAAEIEHGLVPGATLADVQRSRPPSE